jgi:O-antigen/teichoic acid export membrane protein
LITAPLTARALAPEGRGEIAIVVVAVSIFIVVASFGLGWVARDEVARDPRSYFFWRTRARGVALVASPVALGLSALLAFALSFHPLEAAALAAYFVIGAFAGTRSVDGNVLVSLGRPATLGMINTVTALAVLGACVILFVFDQLTVGSLIVANSLGLIVQMIGLIIAIRAVERQRPELADEVAGPAAHDMSITQIMRRAGRAWTSQLTDAYMLRSDTILVAISGSRSSVGLYSVAALVPQVGFALCLTVVQRAFARAPQFDPDRRLKLVTQACLLVSVSFLCLAIPSAYFLIPPIFGDAFTDARTYLLPAGLMTIGLAALAGALMDASRRKGRQIWLLSIAGVPTAAGVLAAILSPQLGVAALGSVAFVTGIVYALVHVGKELLVPDRAGLRKVLWHS